ncbi:hypothetical protein Taro_035800 [Colocasia esculenta]|uniref:DUF1985 domain-containing protein n=1 Tax=Colocasia esculenta TaxID=4460 RepID=A0A843VVI8_COLES|nr:hypothetical protein [Colocasia esculenta]
MLTLDDRVVRRHSPSDDRCLLTTLNAMGGNPQVIKARSSMEIYIKDRDHIAFQECHKMLMRSTPFSFYVDNTSGCAFSMRMLEDITSTHVGGNIFLLGKNEVLFTVEDVGIILGLPSFEHPVCHYGNSKKKSTICHYGNSKKKSKLHERFGVAINFDQKKVHSLIQQLVKSDDEADVEDTVRLWIVLLLCTNFLLRDQHILVHMWFLEHARVRQPINRMAYPRLFRWGTFADKTSPFPIASLTGQQVIKKLTV